MILIANDKRVYSFAGGSISYGLAYGASLQRILAGDPCGLLRSLRRPVRLSRSVVVELEDIEGMRGTWAAGIEVKVDGRWWPVAKRQRSAVSKAMRAG